MSKPRTYTGYAIVTKNIMDDKVYKKGAFGISLSGRDLDTCKKYCRKDQIVVRTYREILSRGFGIRWIRKYPCFSKSHKFSSPRYIQLGHLMLEWGAEHKDRSFNWVRDLVKAGLKKPEEAANILERIDTLMNEDNT